MAAEISDARPVSTKRLERIERIKRLLLWPMGLWMTLMTIGVVLRASELDALAGVRLVFEDIAFYSLPIVLLYIVGVTFYSSYRILESRGYKNLAVFIFVQALAYFAMNVLELEMPDVSRIQSAVFVAAIALTLLGLMFLVQLRIKIIDANLPRGDYSGSTEVSSTTQVLSPPAEPRSVRPRLGAMIAAIVSLVIASIIYFRLRGGVSFVTWGIFFGALLSMIALNAEKIVLGLLFFLDPGGAVNLFRLLRVKTELQDQKDAGEIQRELTVLSKERMKTVMSSLANELDQHFTNAQYEHTRRRVQFMIDQIKNSEGLPAGEQGRILQEVTMAIAQLREKQALPSLPPPDYSGYSIGEKVKELVGLTEDEQLLAMKEGLIAESQGHIWSVPAQHRIRLALEDFQREDLRGNGPIFIARSLVAFVEANSHLLHGLTDALVSARDEDLFTIKGAEARGLREVHFATVTRKYSGIVKQGTKGAVVVVGVAERPALRPNQVEESDTKVE